MTGRLVDMAFTLGGKQKVTLELNGDFREIWDKLHQEPILDVEIKKHREKRSLSANAYFHVLCNKISAETGESEDAVKRRLVVSYGALARDKDGKPVGLKLPPTVDPCDFYPYVRLYETRQENGKDYSCYFVYKESHKMDSKEFAHLVDTSTFRRCPSAAAAGPRSRLNVGLPTMSLSVGAAGCTPKARPTSRIWKSPSPASAAIPSRCTGTRTSGGTSNDP